MKTKTTILCMRLFKGISIIMLTFALIGNSQVAMAQDLATQPAPSDIQITDERLINIFGIHDPMIVTTSSDGSIYINRLENGCEKIPGINNAHRVCNNLCANHKNVIFYTDYEGNVYSVTITGFNGNFVYTKKFLGNAASLVSSGEDIDKIQGDALYAINTSGLMAVSRDTGLTWPIDTTGIGLVTDFTLDTAQNVYAIGQTIHTLYYQNKDTSIWRKVSTFPASVYPQKVFVDRRNRIFVSTNNYGRVYYSNDHGITWNYGTTTGPGYLGNMNDDIYGNIYLITYFNELIYRSTDGGATWTRPRGDTSITNRNAPPLNYAQIINSITGDSILTAATQFGIYYSSDSGSTWVQNNKGLKEGTLNGFWKCPNSRLIETSSNGLFYLNHLDSVWHKPLPMNGYGIAGKLYADSIGDIVVDGLTAGNTSPYMKSSDNGNTWQFDTLGNYHIGYYKAYWLDQFGNEHAANNDYNNGATVYKKTPGNSFVLDTSGIGIIAGTGQTAASFGSDGAGYLYLSGSFTATASTLRRPISGGRWVADTAGATGIAFLAMTHDQNHAMVASGLYNSPGLYYRHSGRWKSIPTPSAVSGMNLIALACDSTNGIIAAFYSYDGSKFYGRGLYCTKDYGINWNYIGLDSIWINQLVNCGKDTTYAVTQNAGVYALACNGVVTTSVPAANSISDIQHSISVYPSPNQGSFTLDLKSETLKQKNESYTLQILDVMGRIVYKQFLQSAPGKQTINVSELNSGVYYWKLFEGNDLLDKGKIAVMK